MTGTIFSHFVFALRTKDRIYTGLKRFGIPHLHIYLVGPENERPDLYGIETLFRASSRESFPSENERPDLYGIETS